jgi:hypothetical protein
MVVELSSMATNAAAAMTVNLTFRSSNLQPRPAREPSSRQTDSLPDAPGVLAFEVIIDPLEAARPELPGRLANTA